MLTNKELEYVYCMRNQLTRVDVSNNKELRNLRLDDNQLTVLDVSKNTLLNELTKEMTYCLFIYLQGLNNSLV